MAWVLMFVGFLVLFANPPAGILLLAGAYFAAIANKKAEVAQILDHREERRVWDITALLTVMLVVFLAFAILLVALPA